MAPSQALEATALWSSRHRAQVTSSAPSGTTSLSRAAPLAFGRPLVGSTRRIASSKAFRSSAEPSCQPVLWFDKRGARVKVDAAVVISLITTEPEAGRSAQVPRTDVNAMALLREEHPPAIPPEDTAAHLCGWVRTIDSPESECSVRIRRGRCDKVCIAAIEIISHPV